MKKTIITAAFAVSVAASGIIYPATMTVDSVGAKYATVSTSTGYTYRIDAEDYQPGDIVSCLMLDAGKWGRIDDDTVLTARFSGWTAGDVR